MLSPIVRAVVLLTLLQGCALVPRHLQPYASAARELYTAAAAPAPSYGRQPRGRYLASASADALAPLRGAWMGSISCQGETRSLDLFVFDSPRRSKSIAIMGPLTTHGRAMFEVRGSLGAYNEIQVNPGTQLTHPPGFRPVAWSGAMQPDGTFAGNALGGGCGNLSLSRFMGPEDSRFIKAERDNGGFRNEMLANEYRMALASTWPEQMTLTDKIASGYGACVLLGVCPMPNVLGSQARSAPDGGGAPTSPSGPRMERIGPNDFDSIRVQDPLGRTTDYQSQHQ